MPRYRSVRPPPGSVPSQPMSLLSGQLRTSSWDPSSCRCCVRRGFSPPRLRLMRWVALDRRSWRRRQAVAGRSCLKASRRGWCCRIRDHARDLMVSAQPATCQWTATSSVPWIRFSVGSCGVTTYGAPTSCQGTGNQPLRVIVEWNRTPQPRSSVVSIAGLSGVNPSALLDVTQAARR